MKLENIQEMLALIKERDELMSKLKRLKVIQRDNERAFASGAKVSVRCFYAEQSRYEDIGMFVTPDELRHILINRINDESHKLFLVENKISKL